MSNFRKLFLSGQVEFEAILDFIEDWHKSNTSQPLPEFLGLTPQEYHMLLQGKGALKDKLSQEKKHDAASMRKNLVSALKKVAKKPE